MTTANEKARNYMTKIIRASLALGIIPNSWQGTKVVFLPKPGKHDYTAVFRPICLMSTTLKLIERLVDRHITSTNLNTKPLHKFQNAFRAGLHKIVNFVETVINKKEIVVACFIDIEDAFNCTPTEVMIQALHEFGVEACLIRWIKHMLENRKLISSRGETTIQGTVQRGCPQGRILSPLLWCLAVDSLLYALEDNNVMVMAYADDVVFMAKGKNMTQIRTRIQDALIALEEWKVKYLGVTINEKLTWREHVFSKVAEAKKNLNLLCRMLDPTWGINPITTKWIYEAIIVPRATFGNIVWWQTSNMITATTKLDSIQGTALREWTPVPYVKIKELAMKTAMRLHGWGHWENIDRGHSQIIKQNGNESIKDMYLVPKDRLITEYIFEKKYETKIDSKETWNTTTLHQNNDIVWYTDGSRKENLSGAGWYCGKGLSNEGFKQLCKYATVYQAEVIAISECTQEMLNLNINCKRITICTDSQAAIKALDKAEITSRITKKCKITLNTLAINNRITIRWVPGHNGIIGNEKADRLANRESDEPPMGPESIIPIPETVYTLEIERLRNSMKKRKWKETQGCEQAKTLLGTEINNKKRIKQILNLKKEDARNVVSDRTRSVLTGHAPLKAHLNKMGKCPDDLCNQCGEAPETTTRILCECPRLVMKRGRYFEQFIIDPNDIKTLDPKKIAFLADINPWRLEDVNTREGKGKSGEDPKIAENGTIRQTPNKRETNGVLPRQWITEGSEARATPFTTTKM
ncbi:uncharacterized protein LOC128896663 [Hylaeus anthracinus]|uniref:uncharacterized protein LOC128896663 n=1 Tax=Hylaeus anthracinus TaxID=313031 RepID=UPI0023B8A22D|nr:uncharacterized protein LOC128896663 [Hylaeus anthracinus]